MDAEFWGSHSTGTVAQVGMPEDTLGVEGRLDVIMSRLGDRTFVDTETPPKDKKTWRHGSGFENSDRLSPNMLASQQ